MRAKPAAAAIAGLTAMLGVPARAEIPRVGRSLHGGTGEARRGSLQRAARVVPQRYIRRRESPPPLAGGEFLSNWNGLTVGDLFERTRKTMPQSKARQSDARSDQRDPGVYFQRQSFSGGQDRSRWRHRGAHGDSHRIRQTGG